MKETKKLLEYFLQFQLTDLLGFGNILQVEEKDPFEDYVTEILVQFSKQDRKKRKQLLRLAKDTAAANRDIEKGIEQNS